MREMIVVEKIFFFLGKNRKKRYILGSNKVDDGNKQFYKQTTTTTTLTNEKIENKLKENIFKKIKHYTYTHRYHIQAAFFVCLFVDYYTNAFRIVKNT